MITPGSFHTDNPWARTDDPLYLLTPSELALIADGTILTSISGKQVTKGQDYIDDDTRGGWLAYGLKRSQFKP